MYALQSGAMAAFTLNGLALWGWMHYGLPLPDSLPHALIPVLATSLPTVLLYSIAPIVPVCSLNPWAARWGMFLGLVIWVYCLLRYLIGPEFLSVLYW